ncbi:MAG: STAS domain-containing protein [Candidatus Marinimicrobia bacterium]|nr:STAS domain-containing protein [Candidatus Neomarinimicrobiota bacterium]
MPKGEYKFAQDKNNYFIKLSGQLKYTECSNFSSFINKLEQDKNFDNILTDLTETTYIDSTNLGLLAKLAQLVIEKSNHRMTVVTTNDDVTELLHNIGFDDICLLVNETSKPDHHYDHILGIDEKEESMAKVMLEAHRRLMNMNDKNEKEFCNVVELMEKQIK